MAISPTASAPPITSAQLPENNAPAENSPPVPEGYRRWHFPGFTFDEKVRQYKKKLTPEGATPEYFNEPLPRNNALDSAAQDNYKPIKSPNQHTAVHIKGQIKHKWGIDLDPEKTYLVTIAYDNSQKPYKGSIVQKISLADAARSNVQGNPMSMKVPKLPEGAAPPSIEIEPISRHNEPPGADGTFPLPPEKGYRTHYQGIYTEPSSESANKYSADNHVPIPAADFQQMVWDHSYKKPYDNYLDFYWSHNNTRDAYTTLSKISFLKAAHKQHHEQSLDEESRKIAMRLGGIPKNETYMDASAQTLNKPYVPDPDLETKVLTFNGFKSIDIFYTRDTKTNKTLLYIPGNSSPLHAFDSPAAMNEWLGEQLKDKEKAEAFRKHFSQSIQGSSLFKAGFEKSLELFHQRLQQPGHVAFHKQRGDWKEGEIFGGDKIEGDPFKELQRNTESAMKESTSQQFVLNSDRTKNQILKAGKYLDIMLLFATPLGIALPPVGILLTGLNIASGVLKLGVGIDDKVHNRPDADNRITYGVFNAIKPVVTAGLGNAIKPVVAPAIPLLKQMVLNS